jgi:hypothetical protein
MNQVFDFPAEFWVAGVILAALLSEAVWRWREAWAKPAALVYGTVGAWYLGDLLYVGLGQFTTQFSASTLSSALLQVCLFLISYRLFMQWLVPAFLPLPSKVEFVNMFSQPVLARLT